MRPTLFNGRRRKSFGGERHRFQRRYGSLIPITDLRPGEKGVIASVRGSRRITQRLADLGLTPETCISIVKAVPFNGPIEVTVRGSRLAIGRQIAENILVHPKGI